MIASFIDGRVRIRAKALREPANMALVLSLIKGRDGVTDVVPNPRTGSVLVLYDPGKISRESLAEAASLLEQQLGPAKKPGPGKPASLLDTLTRRNGKQISPLTPGGESLLLAALYGLTAVTGFAARRTHIMMGVAFAVLAGVHVYDRRRCL